MTEYYYKMTNTAGSAGDGGLYSTDNPTTFVDYDSGYTTWVDYEPKKWVHKKKEKDGPVFNMPKIIKNRADEDYIIEGVLEGLKDQIADIIKNTVEKIEFARKVLYQKAPACPECGADTREVEWMNPYFKCNYCETKIFPVGEKNE